MKIRNCYIENFTVFEKQDIEFCDGINVIIGANSTGKSHLLKLLYALTQWTTCQETNYPDEEKTIQIYNFFNLLNGVFKPEDGDVSLLKRDSTKDELFKISMKATEGNNSITSGPDLDNSSLQYDFDPSITVQLPNAKGIFIPPNDVLAIYPGFTASYEKRELAFDQTYYDICKALSATPLKKKDDIFFRLQKELEDVLQGTVKLKGDRFYVRYKESDRTLEAHLVAEGHRKLATLIWLIKNGAIDKDTILFWDEPETNMNPRMIKHIADILRKLANAGIQIFITTHDYLLTGELSLAAEYKTEPQVPIRFFAMSREGDEPVKIQSGDTLADIQDNAILDEFAAHYDRESELFYQDTEK